MKNNKVTIERGDIWFADLGDDKNTSIQKGVRPVLIMQNNLGNKYSPVVTVVPVTSRSKKEMKTHVRLSAINYSIAMAEQVTTISKEKICAGGYKGKATKLELKQMEKALKIQQGMTEWLDRSYVDSLVSDIDQFKKAVNTTNSHKDIFKKALDLAIYKLEKYCDECGFNYNDFITNIKEA